MPFGLRQHVWVAGVGAATVGLLNAAGHNHDNSWVSPKSSSKSRTPECFYGKPEEHGSKANTWIFLFKLYLNAEHETFPVAKAVTYLRGEALAWWPTNGMHLLSNSTFDEFSEVFLKHYVKPSDSAKARAALPLLKQQESSVETYGAQFKAMNGRITVGCPIDSTSLAIHFYQGLNSRIANVTVSAQPLSTLHDLDKLIAVAEEVEAKLDLVAKQAAAPGPSTSPLNKGKGYSTRGGGEPIRNQYGNTLNSVQTRPGRGDSGNNRGGYQGRGGADNNRGRGSQAKGGQSGRGAAGRGKANAGAGGQTPFCPDLFCTTCNKQGHGHFECPAAEQVSLPYISTVDVPVPPPPTKPPTSSSALASLYSTQNADSDFSMTDVLASVGDPTAVNIMPDPAVVNAGPCPELSGTLNVLSPKGLTMMFHGFLAVKGVLFQHRQIHTSHRHESDQSAKIKARQNSPLCLSKTECLLVDNRCLLKSYYCHWLTAANVKSRGL